MFPGIAHPPGRIKVVQNFGGRRIGADFAFMKDYQPVSQSQRLFKLMG
jgi:hypothetical protein